MTATLARHAAAVTWDALPDDARQAARTSLADGLATMLAARRLEPAALRFRAAADGPGPSTLLAGGTAGPVGAALANGALSHALDYEDVHDDLGLHPNAAGIPVVLALAEARNRTLGEMLTALAAGADAACRIAMALGGSPARRGWYHPPAIGALGAAVAAGRLIGLGPGGIVAAVSLAACRLHLTDALKRAPSSDLRAVRDGFAAAAAVEGALLAEAGVVGTPDPLGEKGGVLDIWTGVPPRDGWDAGLGARFHGADVAIKPWPSCRGTHGAIAAALALSEAGLRPDDVAAIRADVAPPDEMLLEPLDLRQAPTVPAEAKFSIPWAVAVALSRGAPGLDDFLPDAIADPVLRALAARVGPGRMGPGVAPALHVTRTDGTTTAHAMPPRPGPLAGRTPVVAIADKLRACVAAGGGDDAATRALIAFATGAPATPARGALPVIVAAADGSGQIAS